jgi:hypothetical protein
VKHLHGDVTPSGFKMDSPLLAVHPKITKYSNVLWDVTSNDAIYTKSNLCFCFPVRGCNTTIFVLKDFFFFLVAPTLGSLLPLLEHRAEFPQFLTATHILCECEALAHLRFRHLGRYFMEPSDYFDVLTYKILHYIRSAGLLRG